MYPLTMASKKTPAELLEAWRKGESLTQLQAAQRLDVHPNFYSDYERGVRTSPSRGLAMKFRDVCGIPLELW